MNECLCLALVCAHVYVFRFRVVCMCVHVPMLFCFRVFLCVCGGCCHYAANGNTATDRNSQLAPGAIAVTASYRAARPKGMN